MLFILAYVAHIHILQYFVFLCRYPLHESQRRLSVFDMNGTSVSDFLDIMGYYEIVIFVVWIG